MIAKFNVGDRVRVVKYGHLVWDYKDGEYCTWDMCPQIVGKEGVVVEQSFVASLEPDYALHGIDAKFAWYEERQLEKV